MKLIDKIINIIQEPRILLLGTLDRLSKIVKNDKLYLRIRYRIVMGKCLNLKHPSTFCEKIQWLKINSRNPEYTKFVDKIMVKDIVGDIIGKEYIIPTLGVWDCFDDIDFDLLPNQFVLKTNHSGGSCGVYICKDKNSFNINEAKAAMNLSLKKELFPLLREYPYKGIVPKIFAEKYMKNGSDAELQDYKFYCFNGRPEYCQLIANRQTKETIDFYDMNWEHQPFCGLNPECENSGMVVYKPAKFDEMILIATKLSKNIPFVRIDLYYINDKVYFGEMTFFPSSGFGKFTPEEWDAKLGKKITLPKV